MKKSQDISNRFKFAILASRRAKQLISGSKKKIDMKAENPLTIAMEEINQGIVNYENLNRLTEIDSLAEALAAEQTEIEAETPLSEDLAELEEIESISEQADEEPAEEFEEESEAEADDDLDED